MPALVRQWASTNAFPLLVFDQPEEVEAIVLRGHPCLLFVDGNGARAEAIGSGQAPEKRCVHRDCPGDHPCSRSSLGPGAGLVCRRCGRSRHRSLHAGGAAGAARCDAGSNRARRLGASLDPTAGHHRDRAGDPPPPRVGSGVRGLLRGPRSLQGVQRPLQLLRRRPGHLPPVPHPARRGEGSVGAPRLRWAHRWRRFHLRDTRGRDQCRSAARFSTCSTR